MIGKKLWPAALLALCLNGGAYAHTSTAQPKQDVPASTTLFPSVSCNVDQALEDSRSFLEEESPAHPTGVLPWPDITGIWLNMPRGVYVRISQRETPRSKWGAISIQIRSLCDHRILATGKKTVQKSEWDRNLLSIPLKNKELNGKWMRAYLSILSLEDPDYSDLLEFRIGEPKNKTRDLFWTGRM
jgi:hypothetical protein